MGAHAEEHRTSTGVDNRKFAMWVLIGSECFLFGTLMINYLINLDKTKIFKEVTAHGKVITEIKPYDVFDINLTTISTFVLLMSSVAMVLALDACTKKQLTKFRVWTSVVIIFGSIFLGCQAYEYNHFMHEGLGLTTNNFASGFYILTGCHGLHVFVGLVIMSSILIRSFMNPEWFDTVVVEVLGLYWHFVDVIWIIIFVVVYLLVDEFTVLMM